MYEKPKLKPQCLGTKARESFTWFWVVIGFNLRLLGFRVQGMGRKGDGSGFNLTANKL